MTRWHRTRTGPRTVGRASTVRRTRFADLARAYRRVPASWLLAGYTAATILTAAGAFSLHHPVLATTGVAAGSAVVTDLTLRRTSLVATLLVVIAGMGMATPVATLYGFVATNGRPDIPGGVLTLTLTYLLAAMLAHRTTRGRPWVTTLMVVAAVTFLGPFLTLVYPPLGFGWAWVLTTLIVTLRGGGWAWFLNQKARLCDHLRQARDRDAADADRESARAATANLLTGLPATYTVLHNRSSPKDRLAPAGHLDHVLVGPSGVTVVFSHRFKGRVTDDTDHGLTHHSVDIGQLLNDANTLTCLVGSAMRLDADLPYRTLVVIHDAVLPHRAARIGLEHDGTPLGTVTVVTPDALLEQLHTAPEVLDAHRVRRVVARTNKICPPATPATNDSDPAPVSVTPATQAVMDTHGVRRIPTPQTPQPMFMTSHTIFATRPGQPVTLLTDQGVFDGYTVHGTPQPNTEGVLLVPLIDTYDGANNKGTVVWFPYDSLQPVTPTAE